MAVSEPISPQWQLRLILQGIQSGHADLSGDMALDIAWPVASLHTQHPALGTQPSTVRTQSSSTSIKPATGALLCTTEVQTSTTGVHFSQTAVTPTAGKHSPMNELKPTTAAQPSRTAITAATEPESLSTGNLHQLLLKLSCPTSGCTKLLWVMGSPGFQSAYSLASPFTLDATHPTLSVQAFAMENTGTACSYRVLYSGALLLQTKVHGYRLNLTLHTNDSPWKDLLGPLHKDSFPVYTDKGQSKLLGLDRSTDGSLVFIHCHQDKPFQDTISFHSTSGGAIHNLQDALPSRSKVKVRVVMTQRLPLSSPRGILAQSVVNSSHPLDIITYNSRKDLTGLLDMALNHIRALGRRHMLISHFYRNRWTAYFNDILTRQRGLMRVYMKNNGGDPHCPINGKLQGLFFSATLDWQTLKPPPTSYFGEWRLHVPAHCLFHRDTNLYFADFYCHKRAHKVTLVLTLPGSDADVFCEKQLLRLDPYNNDFLFKVPCVKPPGLELRLGGLSLGAQHLLHPGTLPAQCWPDALVMTTVARQLQVEIFYTQDINIIALSQFLGPEQVFFTPCINKGDNPQTQISGLPKNKDCPHCNLPQEPLTITAKQPWGDD